MIMTAIITAVAAYLIGSINFAVIFTKAFDKKDIRNSGSGNAGATNVLRTSGVLPGTLTFIGDLLKAIVAASLGYWVFSYIFDQTHNIAYTPIYGAYLCGVLCMVGHVFPLFYEFRGGKGVAVGAGVFVVCSPFAVLTGIAVFIVLIIVTKIVSLSSLAGTFTTVILAIIISIFKNTQGDLTNILPQVIMALCMGAIIFLKHSSNIKRLISGEEKKITRG